MSGRCGPPLFSRPGFLFQTSDQGSADLGVCDSAARISSVMVYDLDIVRSEVARVWGNVDLR